MFLKLVFILYFLLIPFQAFSLICQDSFSTGSVFVQFAQKHIGKNWMDQMGAQWERRITHATRHWSQKDAEDFLNFLQNRIGVEDTIKRMKSPSYFSIIRYQSFIARVSLYEEYIGESGVTIRLRKSLGGFEQGQVDEIRKVIEYVKNYIGEENMKELMTRNLRGFSNAKLSELKQVVKFVEIHIGTNLTKEKMKRDLESFTRLTLNQLQQRKKDIGVETLKILLEQYNFQYIL